MPTPPAPGPAQHGTRPGAARHRHTARSVIRLVFLLAVATLAMAGCAGSTPITRTLRNAAKVAGTSSPDDKPTVAGDSLPAQLLARIPLFSPAPTASPVVLPPGPVAGWFTSIPTTQPVAFLTIDDGVFKEPRAAALLRAAHIPVTLFLDIDAIRDDPAYFTKLRDAGATIEAHTITHQDLKGKPYGVQRAEVCGSADQLATLYGRRPLLFRPPYGDKDSTTLRVVHDCGMKAAFYWTEAVRTGVVHYQVGHRIEAGDIILMHFRPTFVEDFLAALQAIHDAGLIPARLEDYVP